MKKTCLMGLLFTFCILPMLIASFSPSVKGQQPQQFNVDVAHVVAIKRGGLLTINDTVRLFTSPTETAVLQNYTLGFPFGYQYDLNYAFAYETKNPNTVLQVLRDASLGKTGFYGVTVVFPRVVDISNGGSYEFTIVYLLSGRISYTPIGTLGLYNASFPAYPSLTQSATTANLTIIVPRGFNFTGSSLNQQGVVFNRTTTILSEYFTYQKNNLSEFSAQNAWFTFLRGSSFLKITQVNGIDREIDIAGLNQITVTDSYAMVNGDGNLTQVFVQLAAGAFGISAYDEFGSVARTTTQQGSLSTNVTMVFPAAYEMEQQARFLIRYQLPWTKYIKTIGSNDFQGSFPLYDTLNSTINRVTTTVNLPEGAALISPSQILALSSTQTQTFQNSFTLTYQNVTVFNNPTFTFEYHRPIFWESFRSTIWIGFLVLIFGVVIGAWRMYRPQAAQLPTALAGVASEDLKKFVDTYEERRRFMKEIESIEAQARKGKMPRRVYKARRTTIENRLNALSRDLAASRDKIRTAGPRYTDLMRQLEVAENELKGVEADVNRAEVGYRRGEISAASYHELLEGAYRRRNRAQTTIDGVLLRLKEEIS